MPRVREVIYLETEEEIRNHTVWTGIEFEEFVNTLDLPLENILLLKHQYFGLDFHVPTQFEYVRKENIVEFTKENVYTYGDFCWVDIKDEKSLNVLEPQEIAELLYLGHLKKPLKSPFFEKLGNRFAYLAHDDGWINRLYYANENDFIGVISKVIPMKLKRITRRKVLPDIPFEIANQLYDISKNGLLIDFGSIVRYGRTLEFPIYLLGPVHDIDDIYNEFDRLVSKAHYNAGIVLKNGNWSIKEYK